MNITPEVVKQVEGLQTRERTLVRYVHWALALFASNVIGAGVWWTMATGKGPQLHPETIHIPATLMSLFEGSQTTATLSGSVSSAAELLGPISIGLGTLMIVCSGAVMMLGGSVNTMVKGLSAGFFVFIAGQMWPPLLGVEPTEKTPRLKFVEATQDHEFSRVEGMLTKAGVLETLGSKYVLAQIAVARGEESKLVRPVVEALQNGSLDVNASGETRYALEMAAFGDIRSELARTYYSEAMASSAGTKRIAVGTSILAAGVGCIAAIAVSLLMQLRRRLKRIRGMLGESFPQVSNEIPIPVEAKDKPLDPEKTYREQFFAKSSPAGAVLLPMAGLGVDDPSESDAGGAGGE